jgi:hypothetical protein
MPILKREKGAREPKKEPTKLERPMDKKTPLTFKSEKQLNDMVENYIMENIERIAFEYQWEVLDALMGGGIIDFLPDSYGEPHYYVSPQHSGEFRDEEVKEYANKEVNKPRTEKQ